MWPGQPAAGPRRSPHGERGGGHGGKRLGRLHPDRLLRLVKLARAVLRGAMGRAGVASKAGVGVAVTGGRRVAVEVDARQRERLQGTQKAERG